MNAAASLTIWLWLALALSLLAWILVGYPWPICVIAVLPLLAPLRRPVTLRSAGKTSVDGYSVRGLRQLVTRAFDAWLVVLTTENPEAASTAARVRPHVLRRVLRRP